MDLVGADIVGAIFDRCRLRHPAHSKFARNIGKAWKSIVGDQPGDRRYVHDGALPGLEHRRDHRVHAEIDAVLIDRADMHVIGRSEEHTSELQSLMRISYAVFCLKKKKIY